MSPYMCDLEQMVICCEDGNDQPSVKECDKPILSIDNDSDESRFASKKTELNQNIPLSHRVPGVISNQSKPEVMRNSTFIKYFSF